MDQQNPIAFLDAFLQHSLRIEMTHVFLSLDSIFPIATNRDYTHPPQVHAPSHHGNHRIHRWSSYLPLMPG